MSETKLENGQRVPLSPEEIAEKAEKDLAGEQEAQERAAEMAAAALLADVRSQMFQVFAGLAPEIRAAFYADKVNITAAFDDGDTEAALHILNGIETATEAESDAKDSLLAIVAPLQGA